MKKEVLEDAIEDFDGTLIFVSHDRYFINKFADKTIEFKDGHTSTYLGGYDYYKVQKERREAASVTTSKKKVKEKNNYYHQEDDYTF